jgi:hypothetical protein
MPVPGANGKVDVTGWKELQELKALQRYKSRECKCITERTLPVCNHVTFLTI